MKNSVLEGAANSAPVQSSDNSPCGSTTAPKNISATRLKQVAYSNTDRNPKETGPQFRGDLGGK